MIAGHPGLAARLDAVTAVAGSLWSTGLALRDPELPGELRELAADLATSGLASGAEVLETFATRLEPGGDRRAAYDAFQHVVTWVRTWRAALALDVARERLGGTPPAPLPPSARPPVDARTVSVLGLEASGARVRLHAVDTTDGNHVVLEEPRPPGIELALDQPFPSRLLQADVPLRTLLDATLAVGGLPSARRRGRLEIHPSFSRAAVLKERRVEPELDRGASGRRPVRAHVVARSGPDGWTLESEHGALDTAIDEGLALDLVKRSADEPSPEFTVVLYRGSDSTVLLRIEGPDGPAWPWLDPTTSRWRTSRLRALRERPSETAVADPLSEVAARAEEMDPAEGLLLLEAHLADLRGKLGKGEPVPRGAALWAAAAARARLKGEAVGDTPIAALDLPIERLRLAAAAPIARWLAGSGTLAEAADGLRLAEGAGFVGDLVTDG